MTTPAVRLSYAIAVAFFAVVAIALAGVVYTSYVQRQSERKWCSVVSTLDDAYRETPPATAPGRNLAASIADLRRELGCPTRR